MALIYDYLSEDYGLINSSVKSFLPQNALVPLKIDRLVDDDVEILIKEGDVVTEGQTVAKGKKYTFHSSIPGVIKSVYKSKLPDGEDGLVADVALQGKFSYTGKKIFEQNWTNYDSNTLVFFLNERGVVNTFNGCESLVQQIKEFDNNAARLVVLRLYDDDPSRLTESFLTEKFFDKIKIGTEIIAKALNAKGVVFAYDINKNKQDFQLSSYKVFSVGIDAKGYPCGFKHEITQMVKNETKESPFAEIGCRDLFIDVQTALSVYDAIVLGLPVTNRFIHISGDCLNSAAIMNVKIGTLLSDLAHQCGGFKRKPAKILINGKLVGNSVDSINVPITKCVKSISFLPENQLPDQLQEECIRCGNCQKICPVGLFPESLYRVSLQLNPEDNYVSFTRQTAILCTECGLCNSVCPSRIPLCQIISKLKDKKSEE